MLRDNPTALHNAMLHAIQDKLPVCFALKRQATHRELILASSTLHEDTKSALFLWLLFFAFAFASYDGRLQISTELFLDRYSKPLR